MAGFCGPLKIPTSRQADKHNPVKISSLLTGKHAGGKRVLRFAHASLCFQSLEEFKFSLDARVAVPAPRVAALIKLPLADLARESKAIKRVERHLLSILSRAPEATSGLRTRLKMTKPALFSRDNQWQMIFAALRAEDASLDEHRRLALIKYVQYLAARQEVTRELYREKKRLLKQRQADIQASGQASGQADRQTGGQEAEPVGAGTVMAIPQELPKDRTTSRSQQEERNVRFTRLPKGETVTIDLGKGENAEVFLSRHRCKLVGGSPALFSDQANRCYHLIIGKTTIGRDISCDIIMDSTLRDVSRLHLIVVVDQDNTLHLTDMSSHGTMLTSEYLSRVQTAAS